MKIPTQENFDITVDTIEFIISHTKTYEPYATELIESAEIFLEGMPEREEVIEDIYG